MGHIYSHSSCTIAASSADYSDAGLFFRAETSRWPIQDYDLSQGANSIKNDLSYTLEATRPTWDIVVESSPLSKRGWVLQESMSVSRTLFFTEEGVIWQCNEHTASECESVYVSGSFGLPTLQEIAATLKKPNGKSLMMETIQSLTNILGSYSEKAPSVTTDRLPAIAGMITVITKSSGLTFSTGTLSFHLIEGLDWFAKDPLRERPASRLSDIPSWSWVSSNQPIAFDVTVFGSDWCIRSVNDLKLEGRRIRARARFQRFQTGKEFPPRPMGARDTLRRPWAPSYVCKPGGNELRSRINQSTPEVYEGQTVFDTLLDELCEDGGVITCILWKERWQCDKDGSRTGAMVVMPAEGKENTHRSRGWMEIEGEGLFQDKPRNLVLI